MIVEYKEMYEVFYNQRRAAEVVLRLKTMEMFRHPSLTSLSVLTMKERKGPFRKIATMIGCGAISEAWVDTLIETEERQYDAPKHNKSILDSRSRE